MRYVLLIVLLIHQIFADQQHCYAYNDTLQHHFFIKVPSDIDSARFTKFILKKSARYNLPAGVHSVEIKNERHVDSINSFLGVMNDIILSKKAFLESKWHLAEGILAHEIGHAVNHEKFSSARTMILWVLGTLIQWTICFYATKNNNISRENIVALSSAAALALVNFATYRAASQKEERAADEHLIKYVQKPNVLYALAQDFKDYDKELEARPFKKMYINSIFSTHPKPLDRAAYFEQAARELEEKLANK